MSQVSQVSHMTSENTTPTAPTIPSAEIGAYLRVSSDEQKQRGTIETQRGILDKYVALHHLSVYQWYEDEAVSGYAVAFAARPAGARLMADITSGHVKTVLVRKLDRFGRNAREILNAVHALEAAGARLISLKENVDTSTAAGRFFLTVLAGVAELEREMIVERSNEGVDRRLESTTWMGGHAPMGYRIEGKKQHARLVLDDVQDDCGYSGVDIVRLCWHLLVEQDWTTEQIALRLDELAIPTHQARRNGTPARWQPYVVYRILTDATTTGTHTYRRADGVAVTSAVTPILTQQQYDAAVAVLARHRRVSRCNPAHDYLLRDLLRCAGCGGRYTTTWTKRRSGEHVGEMARYYACATRLYRRRQERRHLVDLSVPTCVGCSVDAQWIEQQIWADIESYVHHPGEALLQLAAQQHSSANDAETHRSELAAIQRQLDSQQAERDSVLGLYRKHRISERDLDRQLDSIAREEAEHIAKRDHLLRVLSDVTTAEQRVEQARTLLQHLHARLEDGGEHITPALKRELVSALVREIRVETVEVGLSRSGRMKRRADIHVSYAFEPAQQQAGGDAVITASQLASLSCAHQSRDVARPACRGCIRASRLAAHRWRGSPP